MKREKISLKETLQVNSRALKLWRSMAGGVFVSLTASAVVSAAAPYVPMVFTARLLEEIAGDRDPYRLAVLAALLLTVGTAVQLLAALCRRWYAAQKEISSWAPGKLYFSKLLSMDFRLVDDSRTHELLSQIRQNANWSEFGLPRMPEQYETFLRGLTKILCSVALSVSLFLKPVRAGSALAWLNGPLCAAGMLAVLLAAALLSPWLYNRGRAYWSRAGEAVKYGNRLFSFYSFVAFHQRERAQDIRAYGQAEFFREKIESVKDTLVTEKCQTAKYAAGSMGLYYAAAETVTRLLNGIVYLFVCLKAFGGAFGVGYVTQYIGAVTSLSGGISDCMQMAGDMRTNVPYLRLVLEFMDIPNTMYQGSLTTEKRADRQYEVEFKDVSFRYPGTEQCALRHVNMKFKVGSRLAVVGENGSGKTTFIKLLCRLYDPTEGQILLNGIDIRKYRYSDYLALFSVVFQDFQLLALSLGENVAACASFDRERARDCLAKAGLADRLNALPEGLDTALYKDLDAQGVEVSGGEAQKIAIARALYKDAPFIVLDEPTAALDPVAEAEIYSKFNDIAGDKTAIYISHRLSSCKFCDEIAVFHEGAVIQQGSHGALLAEEGGKYAELWNAQAQYYTEKGA